MEIPCQLLDKHRLNNTALTRSNQTNNFIIHLDTNQKIGDWYSLVCWTHSLSIWSLSLALYVAWHPQSLDDLSCAIALWTKVKETTCHQRQKHIDFVVLLPVFDNAMKCTTKYCIFFGHFRCRYEECFWYKSIDRSIEWMAAISVESRYEIIKSLIYSRFDAFPLNISTNGTWFYALGQQINQIGIALHL